MTQTKNTSEKAVFFLLKSRGDVDKLPFHLTCKKASDIMIIGGFCFTKGGIYYGM